MPRTNFYGTVAGYGEDFGDAFGDGLTLLAALAAALISASSSALHRTESESFCHPLATSYQ